MKIEGIQHLFGFENFIIDSISITESLVNVFIHRDKRKRLTCPHCGHRMFNNKTVERTVFDLPVGSIAIAQITYTTIQGQCPKCNKSKTFTPDGIDENATATNRLKQFASRLCQYMTASEAADILPFSDDSIRRWDKELLQKQFGTINLDNVTHLIIDEKAVGKHHKYVTLVLDGITGELLYLYNGLNLRFCSSKYWQRVDNLIININLSSKPPRNQPY
jgi:transposase